jgi:hypothetical protein
LGPQAARAAGLSAAEHTRASPSETRPSRGVLSSERTERTVVGVATALLAVYALWRITLGASLGDDGHVIALALRWAQGGLPFVDEMNVQMLGSLWAAPLAWAWTHAVGLTGLVLASRLYFVVIAFGAGYVCYRALRPTFGPLVAALGVVVPLLAPPYNILSVSYNTSAMLGLMVAAFAAFAALRDDSLGWAFASGVAVAAATVSYPPMALGALAFLASVVVVGRRRRPLVAAFLIGGAVVAVPFAAWLAFGIGPKPISETLRFSGEFVARRSHPLARTGAVLKVYGLALLGPAMLPAIGLVVLATMRRFSGRVRGVALAVLPLAAVLPAGIHLARGGDYEFFGVLGSAYLLALLGWTLVPVVAWLRRGEPTAEHAAGDPLRGAVARLFALTAPLAIVAIPVVASTTSSRSYWGMPIVGAAPLVTVTVVGWVLAIAEDRHSLVPWAAGGLIGVLIVLLTITPFRNPWPWTLTQRIRSGAFAGVWANPQRAGQIEAVMAAGRRWVPRGGKVLFMGLPGSYLLVDAKIDTNVEWLEPYGEANRRSVEWLQRRGGLPDTVFIAADYPRQAGGFDNLGRTDPLVGFVLQRYRLAGHTGQMYVFTRKR